nr:MAG TPA: hypothetical protein [Caudoviricetes sp.]
MSQRVTLNIAIADCAAQPCASISPCIIIRRRRHASL